MSVTPDFSPAPIEGWEVLDLLTSLVQKSLAVYEEDEQGQGRYRLLEPMRQYARDRLLESGEVEMARERHVDFFLRLAEQAEPELHGPEQVAWLERLEREHDNLRAAMNWSGEHGQAETGLRIGGALECFWEVRGYWTEAREHLAELLALPGAEARTAARARALQAAGHLIHDQGDGAAARALWEESLAIFQELENKPGIAYSLRGMGWAAFGREGYERVVLVSEGR
jgi:non-specific serine/threonine protein kinase